MTTTTPKFDNGDQIDKKGSFNRKEACFRSLIAKDNPVFKPELDRYHLFISLTCPWAHRTLIVRNLKGLQHVIGLTVVDWQLGNDGWKFSERDGCTLDPLFGFAGIKEYYFKTDPQYSGRFTVPVLWDKKTNTIVNNESSIIIRIFNSAFNDFAKNPELNLYPDHLAKEIDEINDYIYPNINNGVYRTGFATTQEAYEDAFHILFQGLDKIEERLSKSRYLVGGTFTEADIRLFTTLIRFDAAYNGNFKCNRNQIKEFPNLSNYLRELYQMDIIKQTVNFKHIKGGYYSISSVNPNGIVPLGPNLSYLDIPHTRK
ncbi:hypothetical protein CYY_010536 [Polysphondylium violaceum]|uniref:GST C-terminal domain-containing protein n=1 Tax=Polysphondylium violaceum TaxID=133409 RepID=A0A8J4PL49_9MYCE|nr:hypothetical protein CYY_010536 [Polysphondylium violaceum]